MTVGASLPLLAVAVALVPGLVALATAATRAATPFAAGLVGAGALAQVGAAVTLTPRALAGEPRSWRAPFLPDAEAVLRADAAALIVVGLAGALLLASTVHAAAQPGADPRRAQLIGFGALCAAATAAVALAGNLVTLLVASEAVTVATYPLVAHRGTQEAVAAARRLVVYSVAGGAAVLVGTVWLHALIGPVDFAPGGALGSGGALGPAADQAALTGAFTLVVAGLGVKAAVVPLHAWLPSAHATAPAPASALLSGLAVTAGAIGIARIVLELYGTSLADALGVLDPLATVAAVTVVYGSLRALREDVLKRRLAYSTVSQMSYTVLGVAVAGPLAAAAALAHLAHQGVMKATMFYCAGNLADGLSARRVSELGGAGRRMPVTMATFSVAALGMIGVPPLAGFATKWALGLGGVEAGSGALVVPVLVASGLLNAAYFLPIVARAWFPAPSATPVRAGRVRAERVRAERVRAERVRAERVRAERVRAGGAWSEAPLALLTAPALTAGLTLAAGVAASAGASPLSLAAAAVEAVLR